MKRNLNRLFSNRKTLSITLCIILICVFSLTIAYAALSAVLNISGSSDIVASNWDIHFENIQVNERSVNGEKPTIVSNTVVSFSADLNMPGEFYEFTVDVVNSGSIDAMVDSIEKLPELTSIQSKYLNYIVEYENGTSIATSQLVKANSFVRLKVKVEYRKDIEVSDLPSQNDELNLSIKLNYTQANNNGTNVPSNGAYGVYTSGYDFYWVQGTVSSTTGETSTYKSYELNNFYSSIMYVNDMTFNLLSDNILVKIVYYDEYGNFLYADSWKSRTSTNWSSGGVEEINVYDSYIRIAIADTTYNDTEEYTLDISDYDNRYSYEIKTFNFDNVNESGIQWIAGTINSSTGVISTSGGYRLNNYFSPLMNVKYLKINLLKENIMFKVVYYDDDGNFVSADSWKSMSSTQWTTGGTSEIIIENKNVRLAIADTTLNENADKLYTLQASDYDDRYSYELTLNSSEIKNVEMTSISTIYLPDVKYGTEGKGFTCTGLTYSSVDGTFYAGNYGKMLTSDSTLNNTIVHLSNDFRTNLGEIELNTIYPEFKDTQGVTLDTSDNTLFVVSTGNKSMYHVSTAGDGLGSVNLGFAVTGIAYDSRTDTLWVIGGSVLKNIQKDGTVIKTIDISSISTVDQIYLDETNNYIYATAGANYTGDNYVYKINLTSGTNELAYILKDSYSVEGIYINNSTGRMYILNDGYYHNATILANIVQVYNIN